MIYPVTSFGHVEGGRAVTSHAPTPPPPALPKEGSALPKEFKKNYLVPEAPAENFPGGGKYECIHIFQLRLNYVYTVQFSIDNIAKN